MLSVDTAAADLYTLYNGQEVMGITWAMIQMCLLHQHFSVEIHDLRMHPITSVGFS